MNKLLFSLILVIAGLSGCVTDKTCAVDYQGVFKLNLNFFTDSVIRREVLASHWDTVLLISKPDGNYFFRTSDSELKSMEGDWFVESNNIEGDCIGYIHQHNLEHASPVGPFVLSVLSRPVRFSMQFVKVDSLHYDAY